MCVIWFLWLWLTAVVTSSYISVLHESVLREVAGRYSSAGIVLTPEELNDRVGRSLLKASELLGVPLPRSTEDCEIDYSAFCPDGWLSSGDGMHCLLPDDSHSNAGLCGRELDMYDKSPLDKSTLSETCRVKWPCMKADVFIPKDRHICPRYWTLIGGKCFADLTYAGPCNGRFSMVNKSLDLLKTEIRDCRLDFSRTADILDTSIDWSTDCPLGWLLQDDGSCLQNSDQNACPCGNKLRFTDKRTKRLKTILCNLVWPVRIAPVETTCPLGWRYDNDTELCLAPSSYTGPCQLRINFSQYSPHDKALWANSCGVSFWDPGGALWTTPEARGEPDIFYRNGPVDESLSVVRFDKKTNDLDIIERQLDDGWRQFDTVCVASETYGRIAPGCDIVHRISEEYPAMCRVEIQTNQEEDDFVRAHCPVGWLVRQVYFENLIRHVCIAPSDYPEARKVECGGSTLDFSARSPGFKRRWAFACFQRFPAFDDERALKCVENFYWTCPSEWELKDGQCIAPDYYTGPCKGSVSVSELSSDSAKATFSNKCRVAWPCIGTCKKDYQSACPQGWERTNDSCVLLSNDSSSLCGRQFKIVRPWSAEHKEEVEFRCAVHWPCQEA
uniref:Plasmodium falciparum CPW-WPC domain containing protein n=1 Tax=Babesia bovis TaxID=5865 RepID=A7ATX2_BABBO|eukprot:XP_001609951.1 Plasmodium falciparum CPW-WPC domain containing protein [Babesia bovis T2Bo]